MHPPRPTPQPRHSAGPLRASRCKLRRIQLRHPHGTPLAMPDCRGAKDTRQGTQVVKRSCRHGRTTPDALGTQTRTHHMKAHARIAMLLRYPLKSPRVICTSDVPHHDMSASRRDIGIIDFLNGGLPLLRAQQIGRLLQRLPPAGPSQPRACPQTPPCQTTVPPLQTARLACLACLRLRCALGIIH